MNILFIVLNLALWIFTLMLWGRLVLDWMRVLKPDWRPRGALLFIAEAVFTVTDPPLRAVRKVIKPVRIGGGAIDLSWTVLLLLTYFLSAFIPSPTAL